MITDSIRKIRLLKVWEILFRSSDEEHPMTSVELMKRLRASGIPVDRKTLYSDIDALNQYGYEVLSRRGQSNEYFVVHRTFDNPEVQILMDAVQGASFITEAKSKELLQKIALLAGSEKGEVLRRNIVRFGNVKSINEKIYYSVEEITTAIIEGKKISFFYFDYDIHQKRMRRTEKQAPKIEKKYIINPVATCLNDNKYYLIGYHDNHDNITQYRIDKMEKVTVLPDAVSPPPYKIDTDFQKHKQTLFGMFTGKSEKIVFETAYSSAVLEYFFDKFGKNAIKIEVKDEHTLLIRAEVQISPTFFAWVATFGERIRIVSPENVREEYRQFLLTALHAFDG